jgi:hypothetical protein
MANDENIKKPSLARRALGHVSAEVFQNSGAVGQAITNKVAGTKGKASRPSYRPVDNTTGSTPPESMAQPEAAPAPSSFKEKLSNFATKFKASSSDDIHTPDPNQNVQNQVIRLAKETKDAFADVDREFVKIRNDLSRVENMTSSVIKMTKQMNLEAAQLRFKQKVAGNQRRGLDGKFVSNDFAAQNPNQVKPQKTPDSGGGLSDLLDAAKNVAYGVGGTGLAAGAYKATKGLMGMGKAGTNIAGKISPVESLLAKNAASLAPKMKLGGGVIGAAATTLSIMKTDSENGNVLRNWLRSGMNSLGLSKMITKDGKDITDTEDDAPWIDRDKVQKNADEKETANEKPIKKSDDDVSINSSQDVLIKSLKDINIEATNDLVLKARMITFDAGTIRFKGQVEGLDGASSGSVKKPSPIVNDPAQTLRQQRYNDNVAQHGQDKANQLQDMEERGSSVGGVMDRVSNFVKGKGYNPTGVDRTGGGGGEQRSNRENQQEVQTDGERAGLNKKSQLIDAYGNHTKEALKIDGRQWNAYREAMAGIESSGGKYDLKGGSSNRFSGAYQFGAAEIAQTAKQLGEDAPSREAFLADPKMQERYLDRYTKDHHDTLMKNERYRNMTPEQQLGVLGYAHNQGAGGASKWLNTGEVGSDAFGTQGTRYTSAIARQLERTKGDESTAKSMPSRNDQQFDSNGAPVGVPKIGGITNKVGANLDKVDPALRNVGSEAARMFARDNPGYTAEILGPAGGFRSRGSTHNHGAQENGYGGALDFAIRGPDGKRLADRSGVAGSEDAFEKYATLHQHAKIAQQALHPDMPIGSGFAFDTSRGSGKKDWMHIDKTHKNYDWSKDFRNGDQKISGMSSQQIRDRVKQEYGDNPQLGGLGEPKPEEVKAQPKIEENPSVLTEAALKATGDKRLSENKPEIGLFDKIKNMVVSPANADPAMRSMKLDKAKIIEAIRKEHPMASFASDERIWQGVQDKIKEEGKVRLNGTTLSGSPQDIEGFKGGLKSNLKINPDDYMKEMKAKEEAKPEATKLAEVVATKEAVVPKTETPKTAVQNKELSLKERLSDEHLDDADKKWWGGNVGGKAKEPIQTEKPIVTNPDKPMENSKGPWLSNKPPEQGKLTPSPDVKPAAGEMSAGTRADMGWENFNNRSENLPGMKEGLEKLGEKRVADGAAPEKPAPADNVKADASFDERFKGEPKMDDNAKSPDLKTEGAKEIETSSGRPRVKIETEPSSPSEKRDEAGPSSGRAKTGSGDITSPTNHPESEGPSPGSDGYGDKAQNPECSLCDV